MDSVRASAATTWASAMPVSPLSRHNAFSSFMPSHFYNVPQEEDATRKYSVSPNVDRRSFDHHRPGDLDDAPPDSLARDTATPSVLLLRKLPHTMSKEALNSMLIFASDLIDAQFVNSSDRGHQTALARFSTHNGALEARNRLNGKVNPSGDATMVVQVLQDTSSMDGFDSHRRSSEAQLARHLSTSASSAGSSNGHGAPSQFTNPFQPIDHVSPGKLSRGPGPLDLTGTQFSSAQVQGLFSPTSPLRVPNGERQRNSGKTMIGDDPTDDETQELLQDPLGFAENDQRQRTSRNALTSQLAGLRLDTHSRSHGANGTSSVISPTSSTFNRTAAQPLQSPSSELSGAYGMSPLSSATTNTAYPGSPPFQRHQFPPANPADQNPPCNTLYVGNLPMDTLEEELKDLFSKQRGYKRLCFRTKHNGPMCFVEFEDVSFATKALNDLYGSMLSNSLRSGIRLSFSKNPLGVRTGQTNIHSPLASPNGAGFSGMASPPGFSTANGPPPGLAVPPGLNNAATSLSPSAVADGNAHSQANALYYSHGNATQNLHSGSNGTAFLRQGVMPAAYMPGNRNAFTAVPNGFPDLMPRRS